MKWGKLLAVIALASACAVLVAKELVLSNGTVYKDVQISRVTPIGLEFTSDGKAGWVDFRDLPPALAKEYGYDPQKAEEFEKQIVQNQGNMVPPQGTPPSDIPQEANLDPQSVPQTADNTQFVNPNQPAVYDPQYFQNAAPVYYGGWVNWNGRYYPYYWWHHWYWGNHWVYHNGRYYPWHYYHNHGVWYHGKYYPYHHGLLQGNQCRYNKAHSTGQHPHPEYRGGGHAGGGHAGGGSHR